jgi:CRISPR-associated protein Cas1
MPTACVLQPDLRIRTTSERLVVVGTDPESGGDTVVREIPIRDLDRLILLDCVSITSQAMGALLRAQIPVVYLSSSGRFLGSFLPAQNAHGEARLLQYRRCMEEQFVLQTAGRIVAAKIYNQRRILQRLAANRKLDLSKDLERILSLLSAASASRTVEELRGFEGAAAARYFELWAGFLPSEFPFERRSTRPPHNPVNACLSFGATLLYSEMVSYVHAHGLDPALGFLHQTEDGRWSLALDLIEPFRPVLVEALALDLFTHKILDACHFEPKEGGVYLNQEGKKKFLLQYERRLDRQFFSEHVECRTTLRSQLEQQVVDLKASLRDPGKFEPFLMN